MSLIVCSNCLQKSHKAKQFFWCQLPLIKKAKFVNIGVKKANLATLAMKTSRNIRSQLSQPAFTAKERTLANCKLITAWHQNFEPGSCALWMSYRQINCHRKNYKNKINRNRATGIRFFRNFWFLVPISGGKCPFCPFPHCRRSWISQLTLPYFSRCCLEKQWLGFQRDLLSS